MTATAWHKHAESGVSAQEGRRVVKWMLYPGMSLVICAQ